MQETGLTLDEMISIAISGAMLVGGLFLLRSMLKLTAAMFRYGCLAIVIILFIGIALGYIS